MTHGTYDPVLVATSVLIAMFASYTALDLSNRVSVTRGRVRAAWLGGGSLTMGVGIWSMHFIGMLAFSMPGVAVAYDVPLLIVSVVVAIAGSAIALYVVSRPAVPRLALVAAGLAMGAAICGMHYIGIAGMVMPARVTWNYNLVAASILIAIGAAYAALWLALGLRRRPDLHLWRVLAGVVMGIAISGMHYTAMAAMWFTPLAATSAVSADDVLATHGLAVAVTLSTALILTIALISSIAQRELERQASLTEETARRFRREHVRASEEEALRRAAEEVASAFTIDDVLQRIARSALAAMHADAACVEMIDARAAEVAVVTASGVDVPKAGLRLPYDSSFSKRVAGRSEPLVLTGEAAAASCREAIGFAGSEAPHTLVAVPLREDEIIVGALVLWRGAARPPFLSDEVTRAFTFAHVAALAVRRVRLMEDAERRRDELERAERLAALGRVASTIAHEFNNVLMSIQAFHEVTLRAGTYQQYEQNAPQVDRAIRRGKAVTDAVLRLTCAAQPRLKSVNLKQWLPGVRSDLASLMPPQIDVEIDCRATASVRADPSDLEQVLVNLALNARDAMPDGGQLSIVAEDAVEGNGARVHLTVSDTGTGMPDEVRARIFEPLYTNKRGGTGLGLAIVHEVIRAHGGSVSVESAPGKGTTFHILLRTAPEAASAASRQLAPARRTARRIVLVEDDESVAEGLSLILEMSGIEVRRVALGSEALPAVIEFQPDAVVLDVGLPDIDGVTVYHQICAEIDSMPVVFATGHADESRLADIIGRPHVTFIRKPFESEALAAAIEAAVAGGASPHRLESS